MKQRKIISLVLAAIFALTACSGIFSVGAAADTEAWDGKSANIGWYASNRFSNSFAISTAADLYGLSLLVEIAGNAKLSVKGDGDIYYDTKGNVITDPNDINVTSMCVAGNKFLDCTITLTADIDLGNHPFRPIGSTSSFQGFFNGNGHTIKNLYVDSTAAKHATLKHWYYGLFAIVYTANAGVCDLTLDTVTFDMLVPADTSRVWAGGISAQGHKNGSTVTGCTIKNMTVNLTAEENATFICAIGAIYGDHSSTTEQLNNKVEGFTINNPGEYAFIAADESMFFGQKAANAGEFKDGAAPEPTPGDSTPADTKPADTKPADTKPAGTKPADTKPSTNKGTDAATTKAPVTSAQSNDAGEGSSNTLTIVIIAGAAVAAAAVVVIIVLSKKKKD